MRVDVVSIFPDYLAPLDLSLVGKARQAGVLDLRVHDLRAWARDRHRTVDDTPYGGGAGMVMRPDVWGSALDDLVNAPDAAKGDPHAPVGGPNAGDGPDSGEAVPAGGALRPHLLVLTPSGRLFTQAMAQELARQDWLILACGRYEGIDARFAVDAARRVPVTEVSIGDYVLAGGEAAALVVVEAVTRLLPGVLGNPDSLVEESHSADGLLEYPVYTKPPAWRELSVPEVLMSGHHARIARWRRDQALRRTAAVRPDLLRRLGPDQLDDHDRRVLDEAGFPVSPDSVAD